MKHLIGGIACATLMAGCVSTGSAVKNEPLFYAGFNSKPDGGFVHGGTGLVCPETLLGLPSNRQDEYGDRNSDASCGYRSGDTIATIFLSELDYTFDVIFQSSVASVFQGQSRIDNSVDTEASQACTLGGLIIAAAKSDEGDNQASSEPYEFQAAVLRSQDVFNYVQLSKVDGKFLKLRYTLPREADDGLNQCIEGAAALREVYDLTLARLLSSQSGKS